MIGVQQHRLAPIVITGQARSQKQALYRLTKFLLGIVLICLTEGHLFLIDASQNTDPPSAVGGFGLS